MDTGMTQLNLQLFAEGAPESEVPIEETNTIPSGPAIGAPKTGANEKTFTQDELNAIIDKRLERARKEADDRIKTAISEAEKLAAMSADERLKHEREEHEKALAEREQGITKRELRAQALELLGEKGLPRELADVLPYNDADSTQTALGSIEKVFRNAVDKAVTERLKGQPPRVGAPAAQPQESLEDEITKSMYKR